MSGDHNMYQKPYSYLDFECPRCGHCCKTDLARVGEVGVWGEWVGLTEREVEECTITAERDYERYMHATRGQQLGQRDQLDWWIARAIEAKLREKNHG
jgi:hypothetical protein